MSITAARPCLWRSSRNSQFLRGAVCTSVVTNCTQIGQEGNSVTPRCTVRLSVCQFSRKSEALDKCRGDVSNCPNGTNNVTSTAKISFTPSSTVWSPLHVQLCGIADRSRTADSTRSNYTTFCCVSCTLQQALWSLPSDTSNQITITCITAFQSPLMLPFRLRLTQPTRFANQNSISLKFETSNLRFINF
jgi:hypothetical protein